MGAYQRWYDNNRSSFLERRRNRYNTDEEYRHKALERSKKQKLRNRPPAQYSISFRDAASACQVTTASLRAWRRKSYYPEPYQYGNRLLFTASQLEMLKNIAAALRDGLSDKLSEAVALAYANWS